MTTFQKVKLGEICERVDYGFTASASEVAVGPKFLRITDIAHGSIDWNKVPYCKISDTDKKKYLLSDGDIVVARTGATTGFAKCLKNPPESVFASYLVRFRVNKNINNRFVGQVIESLAYKEFIQRNLGGSAQPQANAQVLGSYELSLPNLQTQTRIASVLSAYDDLIENNEKRIKRLEEMAQLLYTEWFVKFKFPGHEKIKMVESGTGYGKVPEGWGMKKLKDIGKSVTGKTPPTVNPENFDGEIPFIKTPDIHGNIFVIETEQTLSEIGAKTQSLKLLPEKTVFVSCIGTLGVVGITSKPSQTNQQINALILNDKNDYCFFYIFAKGLKQKLEGLGSNGATMGNVNKDKFENISIFCPSEETRKLFFNKTTNLFDEILSLQKEIKNLSKTRDLLIPQLVTGKREVK